ncbi:MAG: NUDIX hydrolase [Candidatus Nealsonbacteria bacterium]
MIIGKGAGIILIDNQDKVLLQHRDNNTSWYPGHWGIFGGQIEKGENPEQAARREIKEEIGIELVDLKFFKKYGLKRRKGIYKAFFFTAPLTISVEKLKYQQTEGQDLGFFSFNEIKDLKVTDLTKAALKDFFEIS